MTEQNKTHYRKLCPSNFLGAHDLDGKEFTLTIKKVQNEDLMNMENHTKESKVVVEFQEAKKPWVANITNLKRIAKLHGNYIEGWTGKKVTLVPEKTRAFGETVDCIRVKQRGAGSKSLGEMVK